MDNKHFFYKNSTKGFFHLLPLLALAVILIGGLFAVKYFNSAKDLRSRATTNGITVTVDGNQTFQTIAGFGTSQRVFDDPHVFNNFNASTGRAATTMTQAQQDEIIDLLYNPNQLGLTRVRLNMEAGALEPVNDNSDPNSTDMTKFNFAWKGNDAHIELAKREIPFGLQTVFPSVLNWETWMNAQTDPAEIAEWTLARLRRSRQLGLDLQYYSLINEPSWIKSDWTGEKLRDVIKNLGPRMRAEGFSTMLVIPDELNPSRGSNSATIILSDPQARPYVGAIASHLYQENITNMAKMTQVSQHYNIPLWMTEFSLAGIREIGAGSDAFDWAAFVHEMLATYNVSAQDYMWGFFGQWENGEATLISLNNNGSQYTGYTRNKVYYTFGQFTKFIRPGAKRVAVNNPDSTLKISAYKDSTTNKPIVVVVNNTTVEKTVSLTLGGFMAANSMQPTRTSESENWATLPPVAVNGGMFTGIFPARSVTTFVGSDAIVVPSPLASMLLTPIPTTSTIPITTPTATAKPQPSITHAPVASPSVTPITTHQPAVTPSSIVAPTVHPTPAPSPVGHGSVVTILAAGTSAKNIGPTMRLTIGGTTVQSWSNIGGDPSSRRFTTYTYISPVKISRAEVRVYFTNDYYNPLLGLDRNLIVDKIMIDNITYETEALSVYSQGSHSSNNGCGGGYKHSEWLDCNGYFQY